MGALTYFERIELGRARDRERINRLRADPAYRAAENAKERARAKERRANDPEWAERYRKISRESAKRCRLARKADKAMSEAAE